MQALQNIDNLNDPPKYSHLRAQFVNFLPTRPPLHLQILPCNPEIFAFPFISDLQNRRVPLVATQLKFLDGVSQPFLSFLESSVC